MLSKRKLELKRYDLFLAIEISFKGDTQYFEDARIILTSPACN